MASAPASVATAIARSKPEPDFGSVAGERFTVMRRLGHASPDDVTAARTRSRDSANEASGSPTSVNAGSEGARCASTSTTCPVSPTSATPSVRPRTI